MNNQNLSSAMGRIKSGVATDSDRFEFEMKEVDLKWELAQSEVEIARQMRLLQILLGYGEEAKLTFSEPRTHDHQYDSVLDHWAKQHEFLYKESEIQGEQSSLSPSTRAG